LKELKSRLHANESLQNQEIERLTFEVGQLMSDRAVWKDELDTLQQSNYHLQDDYERHQKEIIELNQSLIEVNQVGQGYQKQWEEACLNLKRVEGQLEEQAGSNSALDKAHKENSELRRVQKEWEAKVEVLNSHLGAERLIIESLKLELEEIKGIEETHSRLIKDLKERDKKATTEFNELRIHIGELMNEKQEWLQVERKLNESMTQFQDENIFLKQKLHTDVPSYNHHFMKAIQKIDDLKQELKIKENDIKQAKNERDSWQHKYHDLKQYQEAEIMKMTKAHGKEKNELKASLEQLNHHSQLLSAQKLELEEKIKADLEAFKKEEKRKDQELKALMTHLRKREAEPSSEYYGTVSGIQDDFTDRSQDKAEIEKLKNTIDKLKADMAAKQNIFLTYRLNLDSKLKEQANQNQKIIQEFENYKKSYAGLEDCRKQLELDMKAVQSEKTRLLHENSWLAEENSE
jgi:chromosome segregation ATPase